jgi:hypothetical protein
MNNISIDKILNELDKTSQLVHKFKDTGKIPGIEKDIVLSKLREIYELVQSLEFDMTGRTEKTIEIEELIDRPSNASVVSLEPANEPDQFMAVPNKDEKSIPTQAKSSQISPKPFMTGKTEILAEKFPAQSFLNEALSQYQSKSDLSKKMQTQPLQNIFSAINVNDKFLYVKELFNNDAMLYQSSVEKLNNFENFNEAIRFLDENFSWDFNDPQVQKLLELVRRRYL